MASFKGELEKARNRLFLSNVLILLGIATLAGFAAIYVFLEIERRYWGLRGVIIDFLYPFVLIPIGLVLMLLGYGVTPRRS